MTRQSISLEKTFCEEWWMPGSSPGMTSVGTDSPTSTSNSTRPYDTPPRSRRMFFARGTKKTRRDCSRRVPTFVSRWSRRRERPVAKPHEKPSGRSQRGDSAWNKTLDHLLSLLVETDARIQSCSSYITEMDVTKLAAICSWLDGQPAVPIKAQLQAFSSGARRNDKGIMYLPNTWIKY